MIKNKTLEATSKLVAILDPLDREERTRVIQAAMVVLGESAPLLPAGASQPPIGASKNAPSATSNAKDFFDTKAPANKGEELAVAAKYREEFLDASASTKDELKSIIKEARRNFDASKYRRDLDNAKRKGLFNKGTEKDSTVLSHYGQNYVDALPDRDAVNSIRKPKQAGRKTSAGKKAAKKSSAKRSA